MKKTTIYSGSTIFLRMAVSAIGLGVLALCVYLLPIMWAEAYREWPQHGYAVRAVVVAMYVSTVPFYIGIYKGWRILDAIDAGKAFSAQVAAALRVISYAAASISLVYACSLPFFYLWTQVTDAPGLMVIGMFLAGMPLIISVAVGILQRLLAEAVHMKSENELTV